MTTGPTPSDVAADDADSVAQQERRRRILDATVLLASGGGFEAVQMRVVSERADVALGTLYRYFPSKIHLMIRVLVRELERTAALLDGAVQGETALDRVMSVTDQAIQARCAAPRLHSALIRAYVFVGPTSTSDTAQVSVLARSILARAIGPAGEPGHTTDAAAVLTDVWLSSNVGWAADRLSHEEVRARMERAARLLLAD